MLPEAVRLLHLLVSSGKHVYVHCTAGINRATLATVGYLTFVKVLFYTSSDDTSTMHADNLYS